MSGQTINKFKQIRESWRVGSKVARQAPGDLEARRRNFYLGWILKELVMFPIKQFVKPTATQKLKKIIRTKIGKLPADKYGAW
jgi:hypothetical protein